jgi:hypothetical protein
MKIAQLLALILTALALVPVGAHLFALPNKMQLDQADYFVTQSIYRGWACFGIVLVGAIRTNVVAAGPCAARSCRSRWRSSARC